MEFIQLMKAVNESTSKEDVVEDEDKYAYGISPRLVVRSLWARSWLRNWLVNLSIVAGACNPLPTLRTNLATDTLYCRIYIIPSWL